MNKKTGTLSALTSVLLLAVIIPSMPTASAGDIPCTGFLAPGTYDGDIVAAGPGFCTIGAGVIVDGNVKHTGGSLFVTGGAIIDGSIQSESLGTTSVGGATVNGDIQKTGAGFLGVFSSTVNGSIQSDGGSLSVSSSTVNGSIQSTDGGTLSIFGGTVNGDVQSIDGTFFFMSSTIINGSVQSDGTDSVSLSSSTVAVNAVIKNASSSSGIFGGTYNGNVQVEDNVAGSAFDFFFVTGATIEGDLQYNKNVAGASAFFGNLVSSNTVAGNLQCSDNSPAPNNTTFGGPNAVSGDRDDQCAGL